MLVLKNITKNYKVAGGEIKVLKGLNVCFRKNEFVSILGPSGCGKTTTLNIVGGLDKYTSGDLIISGKSTKNFTDRDWDLYRNQRIGFVFQSYNLIPHQTVLGNVELALTISGISKEERVKRAMQALEKVGLKGEEHKRPNQLSGGQSQRVAIARALVNEPDILLADEPTGALDSKTSVQIMDLIKEISKEKLVIMVTHNSEIAQDYSTRIIRLVDGEIIEDSNPYTQEQEQAEHVAQGQADSKKSKGKNRAKMSWWTAFKLSARNLFTKRGRTVLTSVAGSIGIIGISAVIAVSTGVRTYIASMQDDMLSGNPITIEETGYNLDAMMGGLSTQQQHQAVKEGMVNVNSMVEYLAKQYNTLNAFMVENEINQDYVDYVKTIPIEQATVQLEYDVDLTNNVYTDFTKDGSASTTNNLSLSAIRSIYTSILSETAFKDYASMISSLGETLSQGISNTDYVLSQYNLLSGDIATKKDEIMIVVSKDTTLTDLLLAQLGYYTQNEFINIAYKATDDPLYEAENDKREFSYSELLGKTFTWYANDVVFNDNTSSMQGAMNPFTYNHDSSKFDENVEKLDLKVVGILQPKENISFGCLKSGFYYTEELVEYVLEKNAESVIVNYLKSQEDGGKKGFNSTMNTYTDPNTGIKVDVPLGITYRYTYDYLGEKTATGFVGNVNSMMGLMAGFMGQSTGDIYQLSLRNLGGESVANSISIYPVDFETKDLVVKHLDAWNEKGDLTVGDKTISYSDRKEVHYTDSLSIIIGMLNTMIDIITIALVSFTSLSLVVSCVMIAIITYVSVVERIKEIGVIRSLGGRKRDVSNLFNAETLVLGMGSGLIGVGFTYLLSIIVNTIVNKLAGFSIMLLQPLSALIMIGLSVGLTMLSGLIPARKAAQQDPVVALRTE